MIWYKFIKPFFQQGYFHWHLPQSNGWLRLSTRVRNSLSYRAIAQPAQTRYFVFDIMFYCCWDVLCLCMKNPPIWLKTSSGQVMLYFQGIAVHCENTNLASMAVGLRRFRICWVFFAFSSASSTGQEGKSRTWQLWIVTWRGCTGTCSGRTRSPSLWSGTPPSGSTFYLKSKLLSFLLLTTSSHHHYHQTCDHQVLMPTSFYCFAGR